MISMILTGLAFAFRAQSVSTVVLIKVLTTQVRL